MGRFWFWFAICCAGCVQNASALQPSAPAGDRAKASTQAGGDRAANKQDRPTPSHSAKDNVAPPGSPKPSNAQNADPPRPTKLDWHGDPIPNNAMARIGTERLRCESSIAASLSEPAGELLANLDAWGRIRVWDMTTGRLVREFSCRDMLGDDVRSALAGRYWDYRGPDLEFRLDFAKDRSSVAVTIGDRDESYRRRFELATGRAYEKMLIADADSNGQKESHWVAEHIRIGRVIDNWDPSQRVRQRAWIIDDARVLTISFDHAFRIWKSNIEKELVVLPGTHYSAIASVVFSPDGSRVASVDDAGLLRMSQSADGKPLWGVDTGASNGLRFSPSGDRLITFGKHALRVFDTETGEVRFSLAKNSADDMTSDSAISLDGKTLLQAAWGNAVHHWDLASGKLTRTVELPGVAAVWPDEIGPEGSSTYDRVTINRRTREPFFAVDGTQLLLLARADDVWARFDAETGRPIEKESSRKPTARGGGKAMPPSSDESARSSLSLFHGELLIASPGPYKRVFDIDGRDSWQPGTTHELLGYDATQHRYVKLFDVSGASSIALKMSPNGELIAQADGGAPTLRIYRVASGKVVKRWAGLPATVTCLAFSPDGKRLAAGFRDSQILVWDLEPLGLSK